jgi:DNA-binding NarL/FixJ family response regulator
MAEDNAAYRTEMERILGSLPHTEVCGSAPNGRVLVSLAMETKPDVVITDIQMPVLNGIEACRELKAILPGVRVLGITLYSDEFQIVEMMEAGASGYLDKLNVETYLPDALRMVQQGLHFFCPTTSTRMVKLLCASKAKLQLREAVFSEEELQLVRLICLEYTVKMIAHILKVAERTVERRKQRLQEKMGAKSDAGIVLYATKKGLLENT